MRGLGTGLAEVCRVKGRALSVSGQSTNTKYSEIKLS